MGPSTGYNPNAWRHDTGFAPIHYAARDGNEEIVCYLLEHSRPEVGISELEAAMAGGNFNVVARLLRLCDVTRLKKKYPHEIVNAAAAGSSLRVIRYLQAAGFDFEKRDKEGGNALFAAAEEGKTMVVRFLISLGLDPKARDKKKRSVLQYATRAGVRVTNQALSQKGSCDLSRDVSSPEGALPYQPRASPWV